MTSDWQDVCDAIIAELQTGATSGKGAVAGLGPDVVPEGRVHRYETWDPEELVDDGKRHLAVWPAAEGEEVVDEESAEGAHSFYQYYDLMVWESAKASATRRVRSQDRTAAFLELHRAVRGRFYLTVNERLGGTQQTWYRATQFAEHLGKTRWFRMRIRAVQWFGFE